MGIQPGTILVVEDDTDIRETMQEVLEAEGFPVVTAADGREALARLHANGQPGLILLDMVLPVMSGYEFLNCLRDDPELADIPVVVVSAWPRENTRGIQGFVRKPVDLGLLLGYCHKYC